MTKHLKVLPSSVKSSEIDEIKAKAVLHDAGNYIVRYIRHEPTVGLATVPVRDKDGKIVTIKGEDGIITDMPWVRKRVICAGIPFACMIAFMYQNKLLIGWSKRMEDKHFVKTDELHSLFKTIAVESPQESYEDLFERFTKNLTVFLNTQQLEDIEVAFAKKGGKTAAIIRGLNDTITINGDYMESGASGPVPSNIAKNLAQFIERAEKAYGGVAANISRPEFALAEVSSTSAAVV